MIVFALALAAAAPSPPRVVVGPGTSTCEAAMAHPARMFDYVWGQWSGMNIAANKPVGYSISQNDILKEVGLACAAFPKLPLAEAILGVHMRFEKQNR